MHSDLKLLEDLVQADNFQAAAALCNAHLSDEFSGEMWPRQLGFVKFLDFMNHDAQDDTPLVFEELTNRQPFDADAHFWLGYVRAILYTYDDLAEKPMLRALELDAGHAYALLFLTEYMSDAQRIGALEKVLKLQPGNLRALQRLADTLRDAGDKEGSRLAYQRVVQADPYVESGYGIMNLYINGVLNGSYWAERMKREAAAQLE